MLISKWTFENHHWIQTDDLNCNASLFLPFGSDQILSSQQRVQSTDGPKRQKASYQLLSFVRGAGLQTYSLRCCRDLDFNIQSFKGACKVHDD